MSGEILLPLARVQRSTCLLHVVSGGQQRQRSGGMNSGAAVPNAGLVYVCSFSE